MNKCCFLIILYIIVTFSCSNKDNKAGISSSDRKQIIDVATEYAMGKFKAPMKSEAPDGIVTVSDNQINFVVTAETKTKYIIDPSKIFTGLIDDDENEDAIITLYFLIGQSNPVQEIIILLKTDGKFMLNRVLESEMKIMGIKNREITAEISTRSPDSPLRDCAACKEIVKYKYSVGDLIRL